MFNNLAALPLIPVDGIDYYDWTVSLTSVIKDRPDVSMCGTAIVDKRYVDMENDPRFTLSFGTYAAASNNDPAEFPPVLETKWKNSDSYRKNRERRIMYNEHQDQNFTLIFDLIPDYRVKWMNQKELESAKYDNDFLKLIRLIGDMVMGGCRAVFTKPKLVQFITSSPGNKTLKEFIAHEDKEYNALMFYWNEPPGPIMEEILSRCVLFRLPRSMRDFVNQYEPSVGHYPVPDLLQEIRKFCFARGFSESAPFSTAAPKSTSKQPTAVTAIHKRRNDQRERLNNTTKAKCDRCGAVDHERRKCSLKEVHCNICHKQGKSVVVYKGHATHAHRGPRQRPGRGNKRA